MSDRPSLGVELADVGGALPAGLPPVGPQGPGPGPYAPPPRNPGLGGQPPGPPPWGGGPPPGSFGPTGPSPGPIPEPVGPTGPSLDPPVHPIAEQAELLFFGTLAPVEATLTWSGQVWDVQIHVLTVEEENKLAAYVARQPLEQKVMAEAMLRMAYSLRTINGNPVAFGQRDEGSELRAKMEWVASWPATLLDAAIRAYAFASMQPVLRLQEMHSDPNFTAAPS